MNFTSVPSKIVIGGNSKLSLNERFAAIQQRPRRRIARAQKVAPIRKNYRPVQKVIEEVEYVTIPRRQRPRKVFIDQEIPIQQRLSFVPRPQIRAPRQFFSKPQIVNRNQKTFIAQNNKNRRPFTGMLKNGRQPGQVAVNTRFKKINTMKQPQEPKKQKSLAELDRELDEYMRKSKHTPITF